MASPNKRQVQVKSVGLIKKARKNRAINSLSKANQSFLAVFLAAGFLAGAFSSL